MGQAPAADEARGPRGGPAAAWIELLREHPATATACVLALAVSPWLLRDVHAAIGALIGFCVACTAWRGSAIGLAAIATVAATAWGQHAIRHELAGALSFLRENSEFPNLFFGVVATLGCLILAIRRPTSWRIAGSVIGTIGFGAVWIWHAAMLDAVETGSRWKTEALVAVADLEPVEQRGFCALQGLNCSHGPAESMAAWLDPTLPPMSREMLLWLLKDLQGSARQEGRAIRFVNIGGDTGAVAGVVALRGDAAVAIHDGRSFAESIELTQRFQWWMAAILLGWLGAALCLGEFHRLRGWRPPRRRQPDAVTPSR